MQPGWHRCTPGASVRLCGRGLSMDEVQSAAAESRQDW